MINHATFLQNHVSAGKNNILYMNKLVRNSLFTNALLLTVAGIFCRVIGFFFRIYLSRTFGAENIGIYQLIGPIMALAYSLTVAGFQTAISKLVASNENGLFIFSIGCLCSLGLSCAISQYVYYNAHFLATEFLLEPRTESLLKVLSLSFPVSSIHGCINGYFYGKKNAGFPSLSQLIEQIFRVLSVYIMCSYLHRNSVPSISYAVTGMVIGEVAACTISLLYLWYSEHKAVYITSEKGISYSALVSGLFVLALPLSASRVIQNALQSIEAIALPNMLQEYGLDTASAFSHYGILTGMTLPLVLFPTAITGSIAVMLMPEVSQAQAHGQNKTIQNAFKKSIFFCFIMGFAFTAILFAFSKPISIYVFKEPLCAVYIRTLCFMCPFMYCNTTLSSIMHGLGKTISSFMITVITLTMRLILIYICVPKLGMQGYLFIMLISQILLFFMQMWILKKAIPE